MTERVLRKPRSFISAFGCLALAVGLAPIHDANAQLTNGLIWSSETDGAKLMQLCGGDWEFGSYDPCGSYLVGLIDGLAAGRVFCPGARVGAMQLSTIAYRHLAASPEEWDKPASVIVGRKLGEIYPCKR